MVFLLQQVKSIRQDQKDFIPLPPDKLNSTFHKGNIALYFEVKFVFLKQIFWKME